MPITYQLAATLIPQSNGQWTLQLPYPNTYKRQDQSPAQPGDVMSLQPDGTIQAREAGTAQSWELCTKDGAALLFSGTGKTFLLLPTGI